MPAWKASTSNGISAKLPVPDEVVSIFWKRGSSAEQHPELAADDVPHLPEDQGVDDGSVVAPLDPAAAVAHEELEELLSAKEQGKSVNAIEGRPNLTKSSGAVFYMPKRTYY